MNSGGEVVATEHSTASQLTQSICPPVVSPCLECCCTYSRTRSYFYRNPTISISDPAPAAGGFMCSNYYGEEDVERYIAVWRKRATCTWYPCLCMCSPVLAPLYAAVPTKPRFQRLFVLWKRSAFEHQMTPVFPPTHPTLSIVTSNLEPLQAKRLVPHIFPACGHVHGYARQLAWGPCPMCRTPGPLVEVRTTQTMLWKLC